MRNQSSVFGKRPVTCTSQGAFYYGDASHFELQRYDTQGRLGSLIRRDYQPQRVTEELKVAIRAEGAVHPNAMFASQLPPYRRCIVDSEGWLWVQEYDRPGVQNVTWSIFDTEGTWTAKASTPKSWVITDIGKDYVLVVDRNEFDVQVVKAFALTRTLGMY